MLQLPGSVSVSRGSRNGVLRGVSSECGVSLVFECQWLIVLSSSAEGPTDAEAPDNPTVSFHP